MMVPIQDRYHLAFGETKNAMPYYDRRKLDRHLFALGIRNCFLKMPEAGRCR